MRVGLMLRNHLHMLHTMAAGTIVELTLWFLRDVKTKFQLLGLYRC